MYAPFNIRPFRLAGTCLFLVFVLRAGPTAAQHCDTMLIELGKKFGEEGYQPRGAKGLCSGLYYETVSAPFIDLVSFTRGKILYKLKDDEILSIKPEVSKKQYQNVYLRGTSFTMRPRYRIDEPIANKAEVKIKGMLKDESVTSDKLGLFAHLIQNNNTRIYIPVQTTSKYYATPESEKLYVTFLSNLEIDKVVYKYAPHVNGVCGKYSEEIAMSSAFRQGAPIVIELPDQTPPKEMCLEVKVKPVGTDQPRPYTFTVYVPNATDR